MKKLLVILLAGIMMMSVTSCTDRDNKPSEDTSSSASSSQTSSKPEKGEPKDEKQKELEEKLSKTMNEQYGKGTTLKFVEKKEINGKNCYVYEAQNGIVSNMVIAIAEDETMYQKDAGSGSFLTIEPVLTPGRYLIDLLNSDYAANLVRDINAVGDQIRGGTYKSYPADFADKSKFPRVSDTEQLIYCYNNDSYLDKDLKEKNIVTIVLPVDDANVMTCEVSMVKDESEKGRKLALSNFKFETNFNLEKFAKDNNCEIHKGNQVK